MKILGLIPARGGSKGLPGKNALPLGGVSLVGRTILAARRCGVLDRLWVSTDDRAGGRGLRRTRAVAAPQGTRARRLGLGPHLEN